MHIIQKKGKYIHIYKYINMIIYIYINIYEYLYINISTSENEALFLYFKNFKNFRKF